MDFEFKSSIYCFIHHLFRVRCDGSLSPYYANWVQFGTFRLILSVMNLFEASYSNTPDFMVIKVCTL